MVKSVVEEAVGLCAHMCVLVNQAFSLRASLHILGIWSFPELCPPPSMSTHTHTSAQKKTHTCRKACTESVFYLPLDVLWERNRHPQFTFRVSRYT